MIIYHRGGRSDTCSGLYRTFQYKGIEPVRVFLHFESGSGILCSGSDILGRAGEYILYKHIFRVCTYIL